MCRTGTGSQCRSYFVVLTLHGYATHEIFDDYEMRRFMFMDYVIFQGVIEPLAEQMMLQDLERKFRKSHTSMEKFGFPPLKEYQLNWKRQYPIGKTMTYNLDKASC
jgi:hypothetical protein